MADVLEYLLGHPVFAEDTFQLPQEKKLGDIRRRYANSGSAVDKAAVLVTEGGGARMHALVGLCEVRLSYCVTIKKKGSFFSSDLFVFLFRSSHARTLHKTFGSYSPAPRRRVPRSLAQAI